MDVYGSTEYAWYSLILDEYTAYAYAEQAIADRLQEERAAALRAMPYSQYLATPEWGARRLEALMRDSWRCRVCSSIHQLHVHHRFYARRGEEHADDLTTLCGACHRLFHEGGRMPVSR
jgi:hypothetical protein